MGKTPVNVEQNTVNSRNKNVQFNTINGKHDQAKSGITLGVFTTHVHQLPAVTQTWEITTKICQK